MNLIVRPAAERDILQAYIWYESHQDDLGMQFLTCLGDLLGDIKEFPASHTIVYSSL